MRKTSLIYKHPLKDHVRYYFFYIFLLIIIYFLFFSKFVLTYFINVAGTPYEGGLFKMKLVLSKEFPAVPPQGMK